MSFLQTSSYWMPDYNQCHNRVSDPNVTRRQFVFLKMQFVRTIVSADFFVYICTKELYK